MEGHGNFKWEDGREYDGEYMNDRKHGYGRFQYANGEIYEGNWSNGKKNGEGKVRLKRRFYALIHNLVNLMRTTLFTMIL